MTFFQFYDAHFVGLSIVIVLVALFIAGGISDMKK